MQGPFFTNSVVSRHAAHLGHVVHVGRVDDGRVAETVFNIDGLGDRLVDVAAADNGRNGIICSTATKRVGFVGLAEEQLDVGATLLPAARASITASCR